MRRKNRIYLYVHYVQMWPGRRRCPKVSSFDILEPILPGDRSIFVRNSDNSILLDKPAITLEKIHWNGICSLFGML